MRHYDYIIAGSGLAGLYAAYHAAEHGKVALVTKAGADGEQFVFRAGRDCRRDGRT